MLATERRKQARNADGKIGVTARVNPLAAGLAVGMWIETAEEREGGGKTAKDEELGRELRTETETASDVPQMHSASAVGKR